MCISTAYLGMFVNQNKQIIGKNKVEACCHGHTSVITVLWLLV